jgi:hypothetical protein
MWEEPNPKVTKNHHESKKKLDRRIGKSIR